MSRYYASSPVDFLCPHQDDNAMINASFPAGSNYHSFFLEGSVELEKFLQINSGKIVDTRFKEVTMKLVNAYKNEWRERFKLTYYVDGESVSNSIAHFPLPSSLMILDVVTLDFSTKNHKAYIHIEVNGSLTWRVRFVADSLGILRSMVSDLMREYYVDDGSEESTRDKPKLGVLEVSREGIRIEEVELSENRVMASDALEMHFGPEILQFENHLNDSLANHDSGLHLFQGLAGTGKSSFLNHLTANLAETHRLIYIPVSAFSAISSPESIGFWVNLAKRQKYGKKNVLIVEDAEALIQNREEIDAGQASVVSTLLNLGDGLLGNILNLHLIATINANYEDIDSALLRAGRLRSYHEFKPLDKDHAQRLAEHLKRDLPEDNQHYTLAEIYNGKSQKGQKKEGVIGFQVTA